MAVRKQIPFNSGMFFITFTNAGFLPLFEISNSYYDLVYKFFDVLKSKGHFVNAYVIMPNHVHAILSFTNTVKDINKIIGDGKRFIAYEIVKRLGEMKRFDILDTLKSFVNNNDKLKGKIHEVFEPSFDWKECIDDYLIEQKLNYIHMNPCVYKPQLAASPCDYLHSSANYYLGNGKIIYEIAHRMQMKDINFDKK